MPRPALFSFLLLSTTAVSGSAQRPVVIGDTIRVTWAEGIGSLTGVVRSASSAEVLLLVEPGDERQVPVSLVGSLKVKDGRRTAAGRGARIGFVTGMLAGAGMGIVAAASSGSDDFIVFGPEVIPVVAGMTGLVGGFLGLFVGALFQEDRWVLAQFPRPDQLSVLRGTPQIAPELRIGAESTVLLGVRLRR